MIKKIDVPILGFILTVGLLLNCSNLNGPNGASDREKIYVGGANAALWENGTYKGIVPNLDGPIWRLISMNGMLYKLSNYLGNANHTGQFSSDSALIEFGAGTISRSMKTNGTNIYVVGNSGTRACYWVIDSHIKTLGKQPPPTPPVFMNDGNASEGNDIAISGNDVYVLGTASIGSVPCVWKNGVQTMLTDSSKLTMAFSIAVSGNDVYIAGFEYVGGFNFACLLKNGQKIYLQKSNFENSGADCVTVFNNEAYVVFHEEGKPYFWKNGTSIELSTNSGFGSANAIIVDNGDVYIAGGTTAACYWKNGKLTVMNKTDFGANTAALCIAVARE